MPYLNKFRRNLWGDSKAYNHKDLQTDSIPKNTLSYSDWQKPCKPVKILRPIFHYHTTLLRCVYGKVNKECNVLSAPVSTSSRERRWKRHLTACRWQHARELLVIQDDSLAPFFNVNGMVLKAPCSCGNFSITVVRPAA
jgi:hypothetical protein